jgi:hypothetical protein
MTNLYKLTFEFITRSEAETGLIGYLLTENDEQVYEYIVKTYSNCWRDLENNEQTEEDEETFKEKILRQRGQINDDDANDLDGPDYFYLILYGWELLKENVTGDYSEMIELAIIATFNNEL